MKNDHLVPPVVLDIITKLNAERLGENERLALIQRLEVTKEFCERALGREQQKRRSR
jgi:hypothetical protein